MPPPIPTERELQTLHILWARGEATVRQVYEELRPQFPIAQNTVQAFLRIMERKELVTHSVCGRTFVYRPLIDQQWAGRILASRVLDGVFDGSAIALLQCILSVREPSLAELDQLAASLSEYRASRLARKAG